MASDFGFEICAGGRYVIYGTGIDSQRFSQAVIDREGVIVGYCDSDPSKRGERFHTKPIWGSDELSGHRDEYDRIIVASIKYYPEIAEKLDSLGFRRGTDYMYTPVF